MQAISLIQKIRKPNTQNNSLPNYRNAHPPDAPILMISTGLTEQQVFNSFVNIDPGSPKVESEEPTQTKQPLELSVRVLDIWSSDDENEARVDLWENKKKEESQLVGKVK